MGGSGRCWRRGSLSEGLKSESGGGLIPQTYGEGTVRQVAAQPLALDFKDALSCGAGPLGSVMMEKNQGAVPCGGL